MWACGEERGGRCVGGGNGGRGGGFGGRGCRLMMCATVLHGGVCHRASAHVGVGIR